MLGSGNLVFVVDCGGWEKSSKKPPTGYGIESKSRDKPKMPLLCWFGLGVQFLRGSGW